MNLFVTGGAGYIGSAAAQMLLEAGHQVTVYDSLITGHRQAIPVGAHFIQGDLADAAALAAALHAERFEAVLHFAAFIEASESMADPGKYFHNNLVRSLELIEACVGAGIERFVFSSSAAVYASSDAPLTERSPLGPANVYGQTKLMIEQALGWYQRIYGLRYAALRYFNAAGALPERGEAHQPESHLIPLVLQTALGKRPQVMIYGADYPTPDGTCIRDYIHIADLVQAHLLALHGLDEHGSLVLNLGNGAGYSVQQVIETARRITGRQIPATPAPRRPGDPARLVASADTIRQLLGWQPRHPALETIIESAWQWHRTHPDGYGSRQF
jgi:UDP-glucose 4-epimerase